MKIVILAGGYGTRLSEETHLKPKPMVEIGGMPILWHIIKIYSTYGIKEFIICCGYKGYVIKEYFSNYFLHMSDVTIDLSDNSIHVERELALVKIVNTGSNRIEALRIAQSFRAHTVDSTLDSFVFEITGTSSKLAAFINLMKAIGDVEIARSGVCAMSRGKISNLKQRDDML